MRSPPVPGLTSIEPVAATCNEPLVIANVAGPPGVPTSDYLPAFTNPVSAVSVTGSPPQQPNWSPCRSNDCSAAMSPEVRLFPRIVNAASPTEPGPIANAALVSNSGVPLAVPPSKWNEPSDRAKLPATATVPPMRSKLALPIFMTSIKGQSSRFLPKYLVRSVDAESLSSGDFEDAPVDVDPIGFGKTRGMIERMVPSLVRLAAIVRSPPEPGFTLIVPDGATTSVPLVTASVAGPLGVPSNVIYPSIDEPRFGSERDRQSATAAKLKSLQAAMSGRWLHRRSRCLHLGS